MSSSKVQVSIVIVCMNNLKNLDTCLNSIRKYTTNITYEVFVVAYMFSKDNLYILKELYPWVKVIESNTIRGFAENNNLALINTIGKYVFCLNDDTEIEENVVEKLYNDFEYLPNNAAVVSPIIHLTERHLLEIGRPKMKWWNFLLWQLHIGTEKRGFNYTDSESGLGKTYNLSGAAFMIKREVFKQIGWFDDYFFFTPEDIALGTTLREKGMDLYVDHDVHIVHYCGGTRTVSWVSTATYPAAIKGGLVYFSKGSKMLYFLLSMGITFVMLIKLMAAFVLSFKGKKPNKESVTMVAILNTICSTYSAKTPKEIFTKYYTKIKVNK